MKRVFFIAALFLTILLGRSQNQKTLLFIGSYTRGEPSTGIYVYEFNQESGGLKQLSTVENIINPSFLTISSDGKYLYACTETKLKKHDGVLAAFKVDSVKGKLSLVNKQTTGGENPVYLSPDKTNKFLVNANYSGASISVHPIKTDGGLEKNTNLFHFKDSSVILQRQESSHPHAAIISPDLKFVFVPDLGADKIRTFEIKGEQLSERKELTVNTPGGSGPRHMVFHPDGNFAYCTGELNGNILSYSYSNGELTFIQMLSSYSKAEPYYATADIHISPDGKFLYTSNRGEENSISVFSIDDKGKLEKAGQSETGGKHPRFFNMDPSGNFLLVANLETGNIVVFKRNPATGLLSKTLNEIKITAPSCLQFRNYNFK